jgi:membrane protease YdiL (CAAX protease family)
LTPAAPRKPGSDVLAVALRLLVFLFLAIAGEIAFGWTLAALVDPRRGLLVIAVLTTLFASLVSNGLSMRIWEQRTLIDLGLGWNAASVRNVVVGLAGGILAGLFVVLGPVLEGAAELEKTPQPMEWSSAAFVSLALLFGVVGEELLFRGYAFQILLSRLGPFATILPVSVLFALAHFSNPGMTSLALLNTGLWGIALGYAFWRSGDLWLPIGLHFGWNWMLPLFGANLSGFTMSLSGYQLRWRTGALWSGGDYGPEGGLATTLAVALLFVWLVWKAPVKRQTPYLVRERWEE